MAALANLPAHRPSAVSPSPDGLTLSEQAVAAKMKVSPESIQRAKRVKRADAALAELVRRDSLPVKTAARAIHLRRRRSANYVLASRARLDPSR